MGDGADAALDECADDDETFSDWRAGRFTLSEAYNRGLVDEFGHEINPRTGKRFVTTPARTEPQLEARRHEDGHTTYYVDDVWCWSPTAAFAATGKTGDFANVPVFYRDRGSAVARAIELHESGDLDPASIDAEHVRPRLEQWKRFVDREVDYVLGVELVTWAFADQAERIPFVAIIDAVVRMRNGWLRSLNAKCGKNRRVYELQTAAEAWAFASQAQLATISEQFERGVLELGEKDYRFVPHRKDDDYREAMQMFCDLGPRAQWKKEEAA